MAEVMFVLKSLVLAFILTTLMQIQVGNESIETKAQNWVHQSSIPHFLQGVADGAVKAYSTAQHAVVGMMNAKDNKAVESQKASKWDFGFRTNPKKAAESSASETEADNE